MRAKIIFSLTFFTCVVLFSVQSRAQEDAPSNAELQELNSHQELNLNDDKALIMDMDSKPTKTQQTVRDMPPVQNGGINNNTKKHETPSQRTNTATDKPEDPLSFNFLYFIIQKFKFSDIVAD